MKHLDFTVVTFILSKRVRSPTMAALGKEPRRRRRSSRGRAGGRQACEGGRWLSRGVGGTEHEGLRRPMPVSSLRGGTAAGDDEAARRAGGSYEHRRGWRRGSAVWGGVARDSARATHGGSSSAVSPSHAMPPSPARIVALYAPSPPRSIT
jgi:hypothetical protein